MLRITTLFVLMIGGLLQFAQAADESFSAVRRVKYVAHQGEELYAPSHSRPTYRLAVEHGLDIMKMDVHWTKDRQIVLSHDADLNATMGLDWKIKEHTLAEIRERGRFKPRGGYSNEVIQTFAEGLELAKRMPEIWVDFKFFSPSFANQVVREIDQAGVSHDRVTVATFNFPALEYMQGHFPEIRRVAHTFVRSADEGYETNHARGRKFANEGELLSSLLESRKRLGLHGFNMSYDIVRHGKRLYHASPELIAALKREGAWLSAWFAYDAEAGEACRKMGYDCLVTNAKEATFPFVARLSKDLPKRGICAHQGDFQNFPGNTVEALVSAAKKGAQMVEFDVMPCKSGETVLMHNPKVDETTDGRGRVSSLTLAELKKLEVGGDRGFKGIRVPTLDEVFAALPKEGLWLNIHVYGSPTFAKRVARQVKAAGRLHQSILCSDLEQLCAARKDVPDVHVCNIERTGPRDRDWTEAENRALAEAAVSNRCEFLQLCRPWTREWSDALHDRGMRVNCYRCDDPAQLQAHLDAGIDFILTNKLDDMLKAFAKAKWEK